MSERTHPPTVVVHRHAVTPDEVRRWTVRRTDVVLESPATTGPDGTTTFGLERGPVHDWERTVQIAPGEVGPDGADRVELTETVRFRLAVPVWGPLFRLALRRHLRRPPADGTAPPWWAPSAVLDARAATVLSLLCVVGAMAGYLGTLLTQTLTYAAEQFDAGTGAQGTLLAAVRVGVLVSLVVASLADRRGRRTVLVGATVGACAFTALGALAPGMVFLGGAQTLARSMSTVMALVIAIMAVEEMPARARAFAVSVLAMTAGLGAGLCVVNLVYVDLAEGAWRIAYVVPLLFVWPVLVIGRLLPETQRFARRRMLLASGSPVAPPDGVVVGEPAPRTAEGGPGGFEWGRFALLASSGFLWSLFLAPAAQFLNEFLRTERGFSGALIAVFVLVTNTPAGIGIVAGGKLADRRGRRVVGTVGIVGGVGFTVVAYLTWGWPLWLASIAAAVVGAVAVPALAVYGPELFPTGQRGAANGGLQVVSVAGSGVGLLAAGWLADVLGGLGPAIAVLSVGPAVLAVLVLLLYPETAGRELEELNPVDRAAGDEERADGGGTLSGR